MEIQKSGLERLLDMVEDTFQRYRLYCPLPSRNLEVVKES